MSRLLIVALVLLTASVRLAEGQDRDRNQRIRIDEGPIATLLEARVELGLTPPQVTRLEEIDARMDQQNQPLVFG